jgi:hypothetical protein
MVLDFLFHPERASRIIQQKAMFPNQLGLDELIDAVLLSTFKTNHSNLYDNEIQQTINNVVLQKMFELAVSDKATFQVTSILMTKITNLKKWLSSSDSKAINNNYRNGFIYKIDEFLKHPENYKIDKSPKIPAGSPIGSIRCDF